MGKRMTGQVAGQVTGQDTGQVGFVPLGSNSPSCIDRSILSALRRELVWTHQGEYSG